MKRLPPFLLLDYGTANRAKVWSEKSTPDEDIDLTMTPGGRRDENELFLPNLERQKGEQGVMSPYCLSLCLESYLVTEQAQGWDKRQRPSPGYC